jgi:hypothetical protein
MRLASLQETKMRIGFRVNRLAAQERSPLGFGLGDIARLLECERSLPMALARMLLLAHTIKRPGRHEQQNAD